MNNKIRGIIKSEVAPDKHCLWIKDSELYQFGANGWESLSYSIPIKEIQEGVFKGTLNPNIYYNFGECTELTLDLNKTNNDKTNEYMFSFKANNTVLTLPKEVKWINDSTPTFENGLTYQVSILDNMAVSGGCTL